MFSCLNLTKLLNSERRKKAMKKFYTVDQINKISEAVLNKFGYKNDDYFIDITKIAKGGDMEVNEVDFDDPDVSGMLITKGDKQIINVNRKEPEERKRFTIAHEIAHAILHPSKEDHIDYRQSIKNYTSKEELTKEFQANMLAAALLMPANLVKNAWESLKDVDALADLFKVSKRAAAIRLESLGLLN